MATIDHDNSLKFRETLVTHMVSAKQLAAPLLRHMRSGYGR